MSGLETTPQIQHTLNVIEQISSVVSDKQVPSLDIAAESLVTEKKIPKWFTSMNKKK